MLQNIITVSGQVGTLFLMMAVGFVLGKLGKLNKEGLSQMSFVLLYIVSPCVVIQCFQVEATPSLIRELGRGVVVTLGCYLAYIIISRFLFSKQEADTRDSLRFAAIYGNVGFMGVPLVQAILGGDAVIYGALTLVVFNVLSWSHGVIVMGGKKQFSAKKAVLNPGVIGLAIALALFFGHICLPGALGKSVAFLSDMNSPLAMVVIGAQMASSNLGEIFRRPILYAASAVRLLVFPVITLVCLLPLNLTPALYCATVILAATPVAGATSMFAQMFDRDTKTAAQSVTLSTLLSIVTLSVFAAAAKSVSGL